MDYFYSLANLPFFLAAIAAGLGMWFIQRKDRQKIYLPLLKVLDLPDKQVRRWTVVVPPLVPLLVSCGLMAILLFASFGPYRHATVLSRSPAQKIMMLVDLSPSMQAATSIERYRQTLSQTYEELTAKTSVIWLDSYQMKPLAFIDKADMNRYVAQLDFHPWGVNLDNLLGHAQNYSDYSILVFSDRDQNAWQNFVHQFGTDRSVWWKDMSKGLAKDNIYIDAVTIKDDPDPAYINLEYRLSRTAGFDERRVELKVVHAERTQAALPASEHQSLAAKDANAIAEAQKAKAQIAKAQKAKAQKAKAQKAKAPSQQAMRQTVTFSKNRRTLTSSLALSRSDWAAKDDALLALTIENADSVPLDNTKYFSIGAGEKKALLVTHQGGEKFIDSPVFSTVQSLKSLGYEVDLSYTWPAPSERVAAEGQKLPYQLVVVVGFTDRFFTDLCQKDLRRSLASNTPLWVVDLSLNRQEQLASGSCRFLFPKMATKAGDRVASSLRRNGYSEMRPQLALPTFVQKRKASNTRLIIIRNLTELHEVNYRLNVLFYYDLLKTAKPQGAVAEQVLAINDGSSRTLSQLKLLAKQNVPTIESRLQTINEEMLPPVFSLDQVTESGVKRKKLIPDSTVVFRLLMIGLIILSLIEATYRWQRNRIGHFMIWLAVGLLGATALPSAGLAGVSLGWYRLPFTVEDARYQALAKYVKTRTSLTLPAKAFVTETFDADLLSRPMIIAGAGAMAQLSQAQQRQLRRWLLAGGILISDKMLDRGPLVNLTNELVINGHWQDVSLDNELMRSFHLLPSLPMCNGGTFSEFRLENRIAILTVPFSLSRVLLAQQPDAACATGTATPEQEFYSKLFINILMTALTTDYKKDQIHLPEILKKLR